MPNTNWWEGRKVEFDILECDWTFMDVANKVMLVITNMFRSYNCTTIKITITVVNSESE